MYEAREQEDILAELQEASTTPASKIEGTFENDVLASSSIEFAKTEVELEELCKISFAETSYGDYLSLRAEEHGVIRKSAVAATGELQIKGTAGAIVPRGSLFSTDTGMMFSTSTDCTLGTEGTVTVSAIAVLPGKSGNVVAGTIKKIPISIAGVQSVLNTEDFSGGFDEESDDELLQRLLLHVRTPATSGNANHYKEWALSVSGVKAAKVQPLWNGNGTVRVLVLDENLNPAGTDLLKQVQTYIDANRPIGATVTVAAPTTQNIDISLSVSVHAGYMDSYKADIQSAIQSYLTDLAFDATQVSIAQIGKIVLDTDAVDDYDSLMLNGGSKNVKVETSSIPRVGKLKVSTIG
ncbi:baseplate J/gp47 family protein [Mitsuokella multacida]|uniref:baseplate J/gp47 family protein n=1 Tax=Mitsuokella multacida TaxID=52226 RepID=UPI003F61ACEF